MYNQFRQSNSPICRPNAAHWRTRSEIRPVVVALLLSYLAKLPQSHANPEGLQVIRGTAQAVQSGSQLNVSVSQNAFLNWNSFNIGRGESTIFKQPNAASIVWNRIGDANPSQIYGSLQANGMVVLANQSGFYFGPDAFVKAAGLFITTAPINPGMVDPGSMAFDGPPPSIPIVNHGRLETSAGGSLFLISKKIENHGTISAPGGTVGLLGGEHVMISDRPDGRGLSVQVDLPAGSVDNRGQILADAGRVLMQAKTVNQGGLVQANSVRQRDGVIEIFASDQVELSSVSSIQAKGDLEGTSQGGQIIVKADNRFKDETGSRISAAGGIQGGNGGNIEISAPLMSGIHSEVEAKAAAGWKSGGLLIDPTDIVLSNNGSGSAGNGTVEANNPPTTLSLNVDTAFEGFSSVTLQAKNNITLKAGTLWDLPVSTGKDESTSKLTLQAGNNLLFENGSGVSGGQHWSLDFSAGFNFTAGQGSSVGVGNVTLAGDSVLQAGMGSINILAGNSIAVGLGAIRTLGGGSISVRALGGNVDTGTNPNGFVYGADGKGYAVSTDGSTGLIDLGGISTAAGGDVVIQAKKDIRAFLPPSGSTKNSLGEAGSGAFGEAAGNVTLIAGGNVTGHFVVRNGQGQLSAGGNAGTTSRSLALSLVKGEWSVNAAESIVLQEVRNPNGLFNNATGDNAFKFRFDYDASASVDLAAGNGVTLSGALLPRSAGFGSVVPIYPPKLTINAGAGGVVMGNHVSLFPSPVGSLDITTTGGGDLRTANQGQSRSLVVSDSDRIQIRSTLDFTSADRGDNPLHAADAVPVDINVSGSISGINLVSPKRLVMHADKDISNSSVTVQNFGSSDISSITAGGRIFYQNIFTTITLDTGSEAPPLDLLALAIDPAAAILAGRFVYDPSQRILTFAGRMTADQAEALKNAQIANADGTTSPLTFLSPDAVDQVFTLSQKAPSSPSGGISIGGPGKLVLEAASIDLGASHGIVSEGIAGSPALVPYTLPGKGAAICVTTLSGDINLFSTQIASSYGGDITIRSAGGITLGSRQLLADSGFPRGVISLWGANIDIVAKNDVAVSGSRIAAYDGGNVHILSQTGSVDAGLGGSGFVVLSKPYFDEASGLVQNVSSTIPGSGILTTTFPSAVPGETTVRLGSIAIETPRGNIIANSGGIVQVVIGARPQNTDASIKLTAGSTDADGTVHKGNIEAQGSGVIGKRISLDATGDIKGVVIAQGALDIVAGQNVAVTAIGQGAVNIKSDSGSVSGTIVGAGNVSVSGSSVSANVVAGPGQASVSGGVNTAPAAPAPAPSNESQAEAKKIDELASNTKGKEDEDELKRKRPLLTKKKSSRVTVILPKS